MITWRYTSFSLGAKLGTQRTEGPDIPGSENMIMTITSGTFLVVRYLIMIRINVFLT